MVKLNCDSATIRGGDIFVMRMGSTTDKRRNSVDRSSPPNEGVNVMTPSVERFATKEIEVGVTSAQAIRFVPINTEQERDKGKPEPKIITWVGVENKMELGLSESADQRAVANMLWTVTCAAVSWSVRVIAELPAWSNRGQDKQFAEARLETTRCVNVLQMMAPGETPHIKRENGSSATTTFGEIVSCGDWGKSRTKRPEELKWTPSALNSTERFEATTAPNNRQVTTLGECIPMTTELPRRQYTEGMSRSSARSTLTVPLATTAAAFGIGERRIESRMEAMQEEVEASEERMQSERGSETKLVLAVQIKLAPTRVDTMLSPWQKWCGRRPSPDTVALNMFTPTWIHADDDGWVAATIAKGIFVEHKDAAQTMTPAETEPEQPKLSKMCSLRTDDNTRKLQDSVLRSGRTNKEEDVITLTISPLEEEILLGDNCRILGVCSISTTTAAETVPKKGLFNCMVEFEAASGEDTAHTTWLSLTIERDIAALDDPMEHVKSDAAANPLPETVNTWCIPTMKGDGKTDVMLQTGTTKTVTLRANSPTTSLAVRDAKPKGTFEGIAIRMAVEDKENVNERPLAKTAEIDKNPEPCTKTAEPLPRDTDEGLAAVTKAVRWDATLDVVEGGAFMAAAPTTFGPMRRESVWFEDSREAAAGQMSLKLTGEQARSIEPSLTDGCKAKTEGFTSTTISEPFTIVARMIMEGRTCSRTVKSEPDTPRT
jgi:hypothetical protein